MQVYRDELLKAAQGEEEVAEEEAVVATITANVEMTEEEKNAAIREELAQLSAPTCSPRRSARKEEGASFVLDVLHVCMFVCLESIPVVLGICSHCMD